MRYDSRKMPASDLKTSPFDAEPMMHWSRLVGLRMNPSGLPDTPGHANRPALPCDPDHRFGVLVFAEIISAVAASSGSGCGRSSFRGGRTTLGSRVSPFRPGHRVSPDAGDHGQWSRLDRLRCRWLAGSLLRSGRSVTPRVRSDEDARLIPQQP